MELLTISILFLSVQKYIKLSFSPNKLAKKCVIYKKTYNFVHVFDINQSK